MKDFFKTTFATLLALVLAGFVFIFFGITALVGSIMSTEVTTTVKQNSVFVLDLNGNVMERYQQTPLDTYLNENMKTYGLDDIIASIRKAQNHSNIKGIYINAEMFFTCSPASLQEIRNTLEEFKQSGKFVVAYSGHYTQGAYYVSSVAHKLVVNPSGSISWHGMAAQNMFFKDMLEKFGVKMQIFKVGTYKSAVEPFINTEMSPANREQTQAYIGSIWQQIVKDVAISRDIAEEELNDLADKNMDFSNAQEYVDCHMADTLMYQDEVLAYLKKLSGTNKGDKLNTLYLTDMINLKATDTHKSKNEIAVYYAFGEIDNQASSIYSQDGIFSDKVTRDLRALREDDNIKAVVLRVNSPGGSAYGSEQIWREVCLLKEKKPVVVSMGDFAASGGYYISCAADYIFAETTTLTGSIGIFGMIPDVSGLLTDKLGMHFDVVKTNKLADVGNMGRPMNSDEKALLQKMINIGYEQFVKRCSDGRNIPVDELKKLAEGRVWTGEMAKDLKLVDELGGLDKAIDKAAQKSGLDDYKITSYPAGKDFFTELFDIVQSQRYIHMKAESAFGNYYSGFQFVNNLQHMDKVQARLPFSISLQ